MEKPNPSPHSSIGINGRRIGDAAPVYIIAELSANHHQDFEHAVRLIRAAKEAGADAVKMQTYTPDTLTLQADSEYFRIDGGTPWDGRTLYDLYSDTYVPWSWQPELKRLADELDIDFFSTAFDPTAVDFLERMGVPAHKVSSFELVDLPLIEKMARTGKPLIMSTGMATLGEIEEAVQAARQAGARQIALLKCTSAYPASPEEMNLRTIEHLAQAFDVPVGLSDHTLGTAISVASVALGACIIEKHFCLSRDETGPDVSFSVTPDELRQLIRDVRDAERALGAVRYGARGKEQSSTAFRRSLFVVADTAAGETFTEENLRSIRPGHGLPPKHLNQLLRKRAAQDIPRGTPLDWSLVDTSTP